MKDVKSKVPVITGAASGIRRGMAESFVEAGMKVESPDAIAIESLHPEIYGKCRHLYEGAITQKLSRRVLS